VKSVLFAPPGSKCTLSIPTGDHNGTVLESYCEVIVTENTENTMSFQVGEEGFYSDGEPEIDIDELGRFTLSKAELLTIGTMLDTYGVQKIHSSEQIVRNINRANETFNKLFFELSLGETISLSLEVGDSLDGTAYEWYEGKVVKLDETCITFLHDSEECGLLVRLDYFEEGEGDIYKISFEKLLRFCNFVLL